MAGQLLFDVWGSFISIWAGLDTESTLHMFTWQWVGLGRASYLAGWVVENKPTDNTDLYRQQKSPWNRVDRILTDGHSQSVSTRPIIDHKNVGMAHIVPAFGHGSTVQLCVIVEKLKCLPELSVNISIFQQWRPTSNIIWNTAILVVNNGCGVK